MQYFGNSFMHFTTTKYTMGQQTLKDGIIVGCVVSSLMFVICMELILRGSRDTGIGKETSSGGVEGIHTDSNHTRQFKVGTQELLDPSLDLFTSARMKPKPKKNWNTFLVRVTICDIHFSMGGDIIPTVREQPVYASYMPSHSPTDTEESRHRGLPWGDFTQLRGVSFLESSRCFAAWPFAPPLVALADLWEFSFTAWNYPAAYQQAPSWVVGCAPVSQQLASIPQLDAPTSLLICHRRIRGWKS